jgi:hypothetical protein
LPQAEVQGVVGEKVSHLKVSDLTDQKLSESPFDVSIKSANGMVVVGVGGG